MVPAVKQDRFLLLSPAWWTAARLVLVLLWVLPPLGVEAETKSDSKYVQMFPGAPATASERLPALQKCSAGAPAAIPSTVAVLTPREQLQPP